MPDHERSTRCQAAGYALLASAAAGQVPDDPEAGVIATHLEDLANQLLGYGDTEQPEAAPPPPAPPAAPPPPAPPAGRPRPGRPGPAPAPTERRR